MDHLSLVLDPVKKSEIEKQRRPAGSGLSVSIPEDEGESAISTPCSLPIFSVKRGKKQLPPLLTESERSSLSRQLSQNSKEYYGAFPVSPFLPRSRARPSGLKPFTTYLLEELGTSSYAHFLPENSPSSLPDGQKHIGHRLSTRRSSFRPKPLHTISRDSEKVLKQKLDAQPSYRTNRKGVITAFADEEKKQPLFFGAHKERFPSPTSGVPKHVTYPIAGPDMCTFTGAEVVSMSLPKGSPSSQARHLKRAIIGPAARRKEEIRRMLEASRGSADPCRSRPTTSYGDYSYIDKKSLAGSPSTDSFFK